MLLAATGMAIVALVALIVRARWHPFIALASVSVVLGIVAGLPPAGAVRAFQEGLGATLGIDGRRHRARRHAGQAARRVGRCRVTHGADRRADRRAPHALGVRGRGSRHWPSGVLQRRIRRAHAARRGRRRGCGPAAPPNRPAARRRPVGGARGLTPPHPGPLAAIERLHANPGLVALYGVIAAIPAMMLAGPVLARLLASRVTLAPGALLSTTPVIRDHAPSAGTTLAVLLMPVVLMLAGTVATAWHLSSAAWLSALGQPLVAMLLTVLVAGAVFGLRRGLSGRDVLAACDASLFPVAGILLVVGAGGGFGRVLDQAGVGRAIAARRLRGICRHWSSDGCGRAAADERSGRRQWRSRPPRASSRRSPRPHRGRIASCWSWPSAPDRIVASHVNDGGFWLVKEYLNLRVVETLATWTVLETALSRWPALPPSCSRAWWLIRC